MERQTAAKTIGQTETHTQWQKLNKHVQEHNGAHINPNSKHNLSLSHTVFFLFKDCQRLLLSVLHRCLHLDTEIRKLPESNQQFYFMVKHSEATERHHQQQFHQREINADRRRETRKKEERNTSKPLRLKQPSCLTLGGWKSLRCVIWNSILMLELFPFELLYCY